jgi:polyphenol oxidase
VYPGADCILCPEPGVLLCVLTADCVPVLIHDPSKGIAGAIHCGWKPLAAGIVERAVETMRREWGADPGSLLAALGPSAGPCCYEIGPEVAERLDPSSVVRRADILFADLRSETVLRLMRAGVPVSRIETSSDCTICGGSRYFSHRRDGDRSGRMTGFIMMNRDE